jgi:hypothetical protein
MYTKGTTHMSKVHMIVEVDEESGDLSYDVKNVAGDGCEEVRKSMDARLGKPRVVRNTPEYYQRTVVDNHIRNTVG